VRDIGDDDPHLVRNIFTPERDNTSTIEGAGQANGISEKLTTAHEKRSFGLSPQRELAATDWRTVDPERSEAVACRHTAS
jgi:hypothetical protein